MAIAIRTCDIFHLKGVIDENTSELESEMLLFPTETLETIDFFILYFRLQC